MEALGYDTSFFTSDDTRLLAGQRHEETSHDRVSTDGGTCTVGGKISICKNTALEEARLLNITLRQHQVLVYLAHGHSIEDTSNRLNISINTVRKHTQEVYRRMNVKNRNQAVFTAIEQGAKLGLIFP